MNTFLSIAKALSDESRIRAIMMLRSGELCVCQIIETLKLAPATVSKHMSILHDAGIVERHKRGKWAYYRLVKRGTSPIVRQAMKWLCDNLQTDTLIMRDVKTLCCVRGTDPSVFTACYGGSSSNSGSRSVARKPSKSAAKRAKRGRPAK